ncbi:MAG: sodium:solute symporter family protein [Firmicutes bacterium]|nr:sodium:solute symporter family protein [Bacillota bacterium]
MAAWYYPFAIGLTIVMSFVLSWIVKKYVKGLSDYYVMGRTANWVLFTCTTTAAWMSMWTLLGGAGLVWAGWGPFSIESWFMGSVTGIVFFTFVLGPSLRRAGYLTIPDFFQDRFCSKRVRIAAVLALIVGTYFYIVLQVTGGAIIFEQMFGLSYKTAVVLYLLVVMVCIFISGQWSVVVIDAFGFTAFMLAGILWPIYMVRMAGGLHAAITGAANLHGAAYWTLLGKSGATTAQQLGNILSWVIILGASPHLIAKSFIVKDTKQIYKGAIGTLISGTTLTFFLYLGFVALVSLVKPGTVKPDYLAVHAAIKVAPPLLGCLYLMGAFMAGTTTANAQYMTCSQGLARDLYQKLINPRATDQQIIAITRIGLVLIAIATAIIAFQKPWLLVIAGTITGMVFSFGYFPALALGIFWDRLTAKAVEIALWISVPVSVFAVYTWTKYKWFQPHPTIWGVLIGFALLISLSYATRKTPEEEERWKSLKPVLWPKEPTLLREPSDRVFMIVAGIAATGLAFVIIGLYRLWF